MKIKKVYLPVIVTLLFAFVSCKKQENKKSISNPLKNNEGLMVFFQDGSFINIGQENNVYTIEYLGKKRRFLYSSEGEFMCMKMKDGDYLVQMNDQDGEFNPEYIKFVNSKAELVKKKILGQENYEEVKKSTPNNHMGTDGNATDLSEKP